jgi:hypothetical protein
LAFFAAIRRAPINVKINAARVASSKMSLPQARTAASPRRAF